MNVPCQLTIWYLIPAITAEMVRELKTLGLKQVEIATALGVTPAAVSQYVSGKRGKTIKLTPDMQNQIRKTCKKVASGSIDPEQLTKEFCDLCLYARKKGILCVHHKRIANINYNCGMCR